MTNSPLVSIIIPCYKDSKTLSLAIDSVLRQTYKNIEIIVINDASPETDAIDGILDRYTSIVYVKNDVNLGLAESRNVGLRIASGEYVAFLDADDEYHHQKIAFQMCCIGENIAVACNLDNFSSRIFFPQNLEELSWKDIEEVNGLWKISFFNYLTGASILISRDTLLKVGGYDNTLRSCEDYDLWLRLLKHGIKVIRIKHSLYFYRFNPSGLSKDINAISFWELETVKRNVFPIQKDWFKSLFTWLILFAWLFRHLIRAESNKNSILKNTTLNNARNLQSSFFLYYVVSFLIFLRIPELCLRIFRIYKCVFPKRTNLCNAEQSKKLKFSYPNFNNKSFPSNKIIWVGFFIYSLATALLFQMLLPILLPSLHAGSGLLFQDSIYFHQIAILLADEIKLKGWGVWSIWPNSYTTGNVAILGAIYAILDSRPVLVLPLNAVLHASSGLCLILIGRQLFTGHYARAGSLVAGCLYVAFPSSLNWYAQNHKDEYAALGFLLLLLSGIRLLKAITWKESFSPIFLALSGLMLTIFVRPNNLQLFTCLGVGIIFIGAIFAIKNKNKFLPLVIYALLIFLSAFFIKVSIHQESSKPQNIASDFAQAWQWNSTPEIPAVIDNIARKIANIRVFMAANALRDGAGTMIDLQHMPKDFYAVLSYLSTTGFKGLFNPYPDAWLSKITPFWIIGVVEIAVWYLLFPGMLWLLWKNKGNPLLWWVVFNTYFILSIVTFLCSNLGTLHRIRYPFIFIFILLGCIGWSYLLNMLLHKRYVKVMSTPRITDIEVMYEPNVKEDGINLKLIYKALPLMLATALLYLGLFYRDLLLAHIFGFGSVLDAYQYAANLPLAVTAMLAVPLCPALIAQFERVRSCNSNLVRPWVKAVSGSLLLWFFVIGLLIILIQTSRLFGQQFDDSIALSVWFFPVVLLSGITVLGNAILICNNKAALATSLQIVVPLLSIFLTYYFGEHELGIMAPIGGLVFGQIINLILVAHFCRKCGFPISPRLGSVNWGEWGPIFISLVASASIVSLAFPIALYFSFGLTDGATATFYMGAKIFQSTSVFIAAIFLSFIFPYFIKLSTRNYKGSDHKEFVNIFMIGVFSAILGSLLLSFMMPAIIPFLFLSKNIAAEQVNIISLVAQIGLLQLPFFVASLTIIKYILALRKAFIIFVAALAGQILNICLSRLIVYQNFGVEMLSLSVACGLAFSMLTLVAWVKFKGILSWKEFYSFLLMLLLFITMAVSIYLSDYLSFILSFATFMSLPVIFIVQKNRSALSLRLE
jgi:glycosyltransferase involved in cell wall biosynthesis/peptidoglycan biosynthesis protein MviN/MurJ (putative lipid II flippase)